MTPEQRSQRDIFDFLCRPDPKGIQKSMNRLAEELLQLYCNRRKPFITLFTDEHSSYPPALHQHSSICWLMENNLLRHHSEKGTKEPGRSNTLFAVNYMDRQLRKDVVNYVRKTVNTARNVSCLLERLCVYRLNHNYIKPYRENRPKDGHTHGSLAGCSMAWIEKLLRRRWQQRFFFSLLPLTPGERGLWFRLYRTPLKRSPEYMPKYAWG